MASPDVATLQHVQGKLCMSPTDLGTDFPHGGTALGEVSDVQWRLERRRFVVDSEEHGGPVEATYTGEVCVVAFVLRSFDPDHLGKLFLDTITGAVTGRTVVRGTVGTDEKRAGKLLDDESVALYYSPEDPKAHGLYLYRAIPLIEETAAVNLSLRDEASILCAWLGTPDSDDRVYLLGPRADIESEASL